MSTTDKPPAHLGKDRMAWQREMVGLRHLLGAAGTCLEIAWRRFAVVEAERDQARAELAAEQARSAARGNEVQEAEDEREEAREEIARLRDPSWTAATREAVGKEIRAMAEERGDATPAWEEMSDLDRADAVNQGVLVVSAYLGSIAPRAVDETPREVVRRPEIDIPARAAPISSLVARAAADSLSAPCLAADEAAEPAEEEHHAEEVVRLRARLTELDADPCANCAHLADEALDRAAERDVARAELASCQADRDAIDTVSDAIADENDRLRAELARLRERMSEAERVREQLRAGLRRGLAAREAGPVWTEATREAVRVSTSLWWDKINPNYPFTTLLHWQQERLLQASHEVVGAYLAAVARGAVAGGDVLPPPTIAERRDSDEQAGRGR